MTETIKTPGEPATLGTSSVPTPPIPVMPAGAPVELQKPPAFLWVIGIGVLLISVVGMFWLMGSARRQTSVGASVAATAAKPPIAPGVIATTNELMQPWAAKKFLFRNVKGKSFTAMLVRMPDNSYWAFSLQEPFGPCQLEYVTDLHKLQTDYNFSGTHPMVGDPCSHTVFDLSEYGSGPNGEVRGEIVAGTGVRPPLAIEVEVSGTNIVATRAEMDIMH